MISNDVLRIAATSHEIHRGTPNILNKCESMNVLFESKIHSCLFMLLSLAHLKLYQEGPPGGWKSVFCHPCVSSPCSLLLL